VRDLPRVLLDTNIVLDALVFNEPDLKTLCLGAKIQVIAHAVTFDELQRVLAYPNLRLEHVAQADILQHYRSLAVPLPMPAGFAREALGLPTNFPHCRDADDQVFLAIAFHAKATLVTRDKALLTMRRRVAKFGVAIQQPAWLLEQLAQA
jgi:putative PIN family toxin of toxin-antitoxin system